MFCEDFDDEGLFSQWTEVRVFGGGTVARDRDAFRSVPNSLLAATVPSAQSGAAGLDLRSATAVRRVQVSYDMRVDARDPQAAYAEVGYLRFGYPASLYTVYLRLYGGTVQPTQLTAEAYLPDGGIPQHNVDLTGSLQFDVWRRVAIDFDLRSAPHVSVAIDGVPAANIALEPALFPVARAVVETGIGFAGAPSSGPWKVRYDNVTVDWEQ